MTDQYDAGKFGAVVALQFGVANLVTSKTNEDLVAADVSGNTVLVAPKSGSVVGISIQGSAAVTTDSVIVKAHKDSTEFPQTGAPAPTLDTTNTLQSFANIRPGVLTFAAGDGLGVSYTTTSNVAPTNTNDISVTLFVQFDPN